MDDPESDPHSAAQREASEREFPRRLTAELVAGSLRAARARERIRTWVLAAGLALLALGLPTEHLTGGGVEWTALLGVGERWLFLASALAYGLTFPVLVGCAARVGLEGTQRLLAALSVVLASQAWLAATLSGPGALHLLAASLVFNALLARERPRYAERVSAWWLSCALVAPPVVFLLPAVWLAAGPSLVPGLAALAYATSQALVGAAHGGVAAHFAGPPPLPTDVLLELFLALGVGVLAWLRLATFRPDPGESRPPAWVWLWLGVPLLADVAGGRTGLAHLTALPATLLGWSALVQRPPAGRPTATLAVLLAAQVVLTGLIAAGLRRMTDTAWRAEVEHALEPDDLVLSASLHHRHLLRHRFGLEVVDVTEVLSLDEAERDAWWRELREQIERARGAGRRVRYDSVGDAAVADGELRARLAALRGELGIDAFP